MNAGYCDFLGTIGTQLGGGWVADDAESQTVTERSGVAGNERERGKERISWEK